MRLAFTPIDADGNPGEPFVLGDDATGANISNWLPKRNQAVDEIPRPRQSGMDYEPRDNVAHRIEPTVQWTHRSISDAKTFRRDLGTKTLGKGILEVQDDQVVEWLENCVIGDADIESIDGPSTFVRFSIQGGRFLTENPLAT